MAVKERLFGKLLHNRFEKYFTALLFHQGKRQFPDDKTVPRYNFSRQFPNFTQIFPVSQDCQDKIRTYPEQKCPENIFKSFVEVSSNPSGNCLENGCPETVLNDTVPSRNGFQYIVV